MSYRDRLREFKYTAPSGQEFTLQFDSLNRTGGKKAPVSEFPGQNQGAVQDLGNITPTFPVSCYLTGVDYDLEADRFWEAIHEDGPGKLDHPRWGNISVLPVPETQTEQFVDGAGRSVFQITFIRADETQFDYPTSTIDYPTQVSAAVDATAVEIGEAVPEEITDVRTLTGLKDQILASMDTITAAYDQLTGITDDIRQEIAQTVRDIENNIDDLVSAPAQLMSALLTLYRLPGTIATSIQEKLDGYKNIYTGLIDGFTSTTEQYGAEMGIVNSANLSAISAANAESAGYGSIPTRTQASEIVTQVDEFSKTIRASIEDLEALGDFQAAYEMQLSLENSITIILSGLIDQAVNLPAERTEILDREVTPIQFVFEKYGDLEQLDFFMEYNNLCCDNILLMQRGTEVRYYFE